VVILTNIYYKILIILLLAAPLLAQSIKSRQGLRESEKSRFNFEKFAFINAPTPNQRLFDITSYQLDLDLYPDQFLLRGAVTINGKSLTNELNHIEINFYHVLSVDSILQGGFTLPVNHKNGIINIILNNVINIDESFSVTIFYHGDPEEGRYQSFGWSDHGSFNTPIIGRLIIQSVPTWFLWPSRIMNNFLTGIPIHPMIQWK
jgi:hypothetical protein